LSQQPPEVNTDLNPRCYFYDLVLSGIQEGMPVKEIFLYLRGLPAFIPWAALGLGTVLLGALVRRRRGPLYLYQVLVMGLGTMALEIVVLILYQVHLGYLYRQMGILIAAFMGGMAAGGAVGARLADRPQAGVRLAAGLQGGLACLAVLLALLLPRVSGLALPAWETLTQAGYALVLAAAGFGGGGIFALSAGLWAQARPVAGAKGGVLYAADLLGATLGTLGVSLLVLPVWGILPALYLVAALHAGAALMLLGHRPGGA
jgi:spermidine synthase